MLFYSLVSSCSLVYTKTSNLSDIYNPNHELFYDYDLNIIAIHGPSHRSDTLAYECWNDDFIKALEIFANMSTVDQLGLSSKEEFNGILKELYRVYKKIAGDG